MVRYRIVTHSPCTLMSKRADINGRYDHSLARTWISLRKHAAVKVDNHASAGPRKWRVLRHARPLIGCHNVAHVFGRPSSIEERPPVHWGCGTPWVHVCRQATQDFSTFKSELSRNFREEPVVANANANSTNLSICNWKVITCWIDIMGRTVYFPRNPWVYFSID
jgi:hypothetical protein